MNVKDTAMKFNTSEYTVKEWCKKGYIRGLKITETGEYDIPSSVRAPYTKNRSKGDAIYTSIVTAVLNNYDVCANLYNMDEGEFETYINQLLEAKLIGTFTAKDTGITYYCKTLNSSQFSKLPKNKVLKFLSTIKPDIMLMYGKEASNRKQEIDRQHYTIPNQRPKDKHCGKI